MPTVIPPSSGLASDRAHKRVRWRAPPGKRRPGVFDATRGELVRALELRHGSLWLRVRTAAIVAGYPLAQALGRVRALRSDGAESLLAMAVALLYLADVRTGFLGKPRATPGPWQRYALADLAQMAYGGQTEAEIRRARRAIDVMVNLGWAFPTKQVRRHAGVDVDGVNAWRSEPAVRRLNLARLCDMTGTSWLLKRDRMHAEKIHGSGATLIEEARSRRQTRQEPRDGRGLGDAVRSVPPATGDPPKRANGAPQAIADILTLLKS